MCCGSFRWTGQRDVSVRAIGRATARSVRTNESPRLRSLLCSIVHEGGAVRPWRGGCHPVRRRRRWRRVNEKDLRSCCATTRQAGFGECRCADRNLDQRNSFLRTPRIAVDGEVRSKRDEIRGRIRKANRHIDLIRRSNDNGRRLVHRPRDVGDDTSTRNADSVAVARQTRHVRGTEHREAASARGRTA